MSLIERVKNANRPGPPEHSVALRMACEGAVVTGIAACWAEGEISALVATSSIVLVTAGMAISYVTRSRPRAWVKLLLALGAVVAFVWFFRQLTGQGIYDVNTVEDPLAVLFVWIQVTHAFDVPARRDLAFTLAGSASLMAVAAAQAISMSFGLFALAWIAFGLWGLVGLWHSASEGGRVSLRGLVSTMVGVSVLAAAVLLVLPAPRVTGNIDFPASAASGFALPDPGGLAGDAGKASEPARAGTPAGPTRVGGYLGFADRLDTALRGGLSNTVVMRVRAENPSYWIGETFDTWDGQNWDTPKQIPAVLTSGSPFYLPPPQGETTGTGPTDLQTFYIAQSTPNLVFHAADAHEVWFPTKEILYDSDGTIVSPIALGPGAIYTVESDVNTATPGELRVPVIGGPDSGLMPSTARLDTKLPYPYPRAQALAQTVVAAAGANNTYDKVRALIAWIGTHTKYSTDIPPLSPGADTVNDFLFGNREGFCEQISTALAVMLRTLGIPTREAVGYVPGSYNPITDLYQIEAKDAHAWVQVWFPGFGWQSFDPTAVVPLANPAPGATLVHEATDVLGHIPALPTGGVLGAAVVVWVVVWWRRRRPADWMEHVTRRIERQGARAGRRRRPSETLAEYASVLDDLSADRSGSWRALALMVEEAAYGDDGGDGAGAPLGDGARRDALNLSRTLHIDRRRARAMLSARRAGTEDAAPVGVGVPAGRAGALRDGGPGRR